MCTLNRLDSNKCTSQRPRRWLRQCLHRCLHRKRSMYTLQKKKGGGTCMGSTSAPPCVYLQTQTFSLVQQSLGGRAEVADVTGVRAHGRAVAVDSACRKDARAPVLARAKLKSQVREADVTHRPRPPRRVLPHHAAETGDVMVLAIALRTSLTSRAMATSSHSLWP